AAGLDAPHPIRLERVTLLRHARTVRGRLRLASGPRDVPAVLVLVVLVSRRPATHHGAPSLPRAAPIRTPPITATAGCNMRRTGAACSLKTSRSVARSK